MIEERKTHYSDTKYCEILGEEVLVKQIRAPGDAVIVECGYAKSSNCDADPVNPRPCQLNSKLINVIRS